MQPEHSHEGRHPKPTPSSALLAGALAGLLGLSTASGCYSGDERRADGSGGAAAGSGGASSGPDGSGGGTRSDLTYNDVVSTTPIAPDAFATLCEDSGGFVTTNAACAGSNLCKGLSYMEDGSVLSDHSCKSMNACAGMSCVVLPADSGLPGKEIYEAGPCTGCHNGSVDPNASEFIVFVRPDDTEVSAKAAFAGSSTLRLQTIVAFGTQGVNADGTAFTNMPSFRDRYSRTEIARVVDYVRSLPVTTKPFGPGHP